ncbi:MAG: pyridoxal-phosphate dependent enzyme [Methylobacter sp.]|nr:pyridoxal-phosphate dependent enzyme [Methylobacter sp.]
MHPELIKLEKIFTPSVLTKIDDPLLARYKIDLWMKRDDLLHPVISGNKWRKLKYILDHALSLGSDTLISMGGAYSNHLHVMAYVGKLLGLKTIGYIRGEQPDILNPTLLDIKGWGMELRFLTRAEYRVLRQYKYNRALPGIKLGQYWLPEGGAQLLALKGVSELLSEIRIPYNTICVPCGTGTTLAGMINEVPDEVSILGFAALKNAHFLNDEVAGLLSQSRNNWHINLEYHFGGFAKINADLCAFIEDFEVKTSIPLESVYTGKMMYALFDLIKKNYFAPGQCIIALHTGGLQGNRG